MRRITLLASLLAAPLLLAATGAGAEAEPLARERGTLWVTNRALNNVALYDAATGNLIATVAVGRDAGDVTVAPGTGKAYVANEADNTVSVISLASRSVTKTISVGSRPHHIETSADGTRVVVGLFGTNKVAVIDTRTDAVTEYAASTNPAARTHQAWPGSDGLVFAANEVTDDIVVIDTKTGAIVFSLSVGTRPSEVLVTEDGRTAYVSLRGENKVKVVDLVRRQVTGEVTVGTEPDTLQLTPDGRTLVVALRGRPAQVVFVDTFALRVTRTIDAAGAGTLAAHHWLSRDARYTFVAFEGGTPGVAVIENASGRVVRTDPYPGGGRPHGLHLADGAGQSREECGRERER